MSDLREDELVVWPYAAKFCMARCYSPRLLSDDRRLNWSKDFFDLIYAMLPEFCYVIGWWF